MHGRISRVCGVVAAMLGLAMGGCLGSPEEAELAALEEQALIDGAAPIDWAPPAMLRITRPTGGSCSAAMLSADWALTSSGCASADDIARPERLFLSANGISGSSVAEIIPYPTQGVALVRARTPIMAGSFQRAISPYGAAASTGITMTCFGYGATDPLATGNFFPLSSRGASFSLTGGTLLASIPTSPTTGDRGASCFFTEGSQLVQYATLQGSSGSGTEARGPARAEATEARMEQRLQSTRSGMCVTTSTDPLALDAASVQQPCAPDLATQAIHVTQASPDRFELRSRATGLCLGARGASSSAGAPIVQNACVSGDHQRWEFERVPGFALHSRLRNVLSGLCLAVQGSSTTAGAALVQEACGTGSEQRFLVPVTRIEGVDHMLQPAAQPAVTLGTTALSAGSRVSNRPDIGSIFQRWTALRATMDPSLPAQVRATWSRHRIRSVAAPTRCLWGGGTAAGATATLLECGIEVSGQSWSVQRFGSGVQLVSDWSGMCLVPGSGTGAHATQQVCTGASSELIRLR